MEIPVDDESARFERFLMMENNERILFSGPFGTGKTYFLNHFFAARADKYFRFYISPVHYCVQPNGDIFDNIRYDLAVQVLSLSHLTWEKKPAAQTSPSQFVRENAKAMLTDLLAHFGAIGKSVSGFLRDIEKYKRNYDRFASENHSDTALLKAFIGKQAQRGHDIDRMISNCIGILRKHRSVVLVIDDLDRIDPGHIFRIMNVFAAQFCNGEYGLNDFGFDRIVLACDINNLRSIFRHKYGETADFSGYIDKFSSHSPYYFDNRRAFVAQIATLLQEVPKETETPYYFHMEKYDPSEVAATIAELLIDANYLNVRKIKSKFIGEWQNPVFRFKTDLGTSEQIAQRKEAYFVLDFLCYLLSEDYDPLCEKMAKDLRKFPLNRIRSCLEVILPLLVASQQAETDGMAVTFDLREPDIRIVCQKTNGRYALLGITHKGEEAEELPVFALLQIAIRNYRRQTESIR